MKANVLIIVGVLMMITQFSSSYAQCPDFDCFMELKSLSLNCDYQALEIGIESTSDYEITWFQIRLTFTGTGPTVLFDQSLSESTIKDDSWMEIEWLTNGLRINGSTIPGTTEEVRELDKLMILYFVGAIPGSLSSIDLITCKVGIGSEVCDYIGETIPTISFSSEQVYSGTAVKQGGNSCNGFEGVLIDAHEINNKENDRPDVSDLTISNGSYTLSSQSAQSSEITLLEDQCYEICAYADNHDDCGINGQDVTDTRDHFLSSSCFTDKYQYIAADVNHDGLISTADVAIINAVYMGTYDVTTSSWTSWDVIEEEKFNSLSISGCDLSLPTYDNCYLTSSDPQDQSINWDVIKKGDVDGTCTECSTSFGGNQTRSSMVDHDNMELNLFKYDADNHTYLTLNPNNLGNLGVWYLGFIIPAGYRVSSVTYPIPNGDKEILQWKYDTNINELVISWIDMDLIKVSDKEIKISLEVNNTAHPITDISLSSDSKWNLGFGNDSKTYSLSVNLINKTDMSEHSQFYYKDDRLWRKPDQSVGRSDMIEVISMNGQSYFKGPIESSISLEVPPGIYIVRSTNSRRTQKVIVW